MSRSIVIGELRKNMDRFKIIYLRLANVALFRSSEVRPLFYYGKLWDNCLKSFGHHVILVRVDIAAGVGAILKYQRTVTIATKAARSQSRLFSFKGKFTFRCLTKSFFVIFLYRCIRTFPWNFMKFRSYLKTWLPPNYHKDRCLGCSVARTFAIFNCTWPSFLPLIPATLTNFSL